MPQLHNYARELIQRNHSCLLNKQYSLLSSYHTFALKDFLQLAAYPRDLSISEQSNYSSYDPDS